MRKITFKLISRFHEKYITTGILLILLLFAYGIIGSHFIMGLNFIDSLYYSVVTMATVGYGDYIPVTGIQKIFATTLALGGVGLLAYVFNVILTNFQEKMGEYSKGARKMRAIQNMDNYYVLCGYGRVGKVVLKELNQRKQNVIIFEKDSKMTENLVEDETIVVINKDATEDDLIAKVAGENCRSVIISTGSDVTNLFIVLTIRETNPDAWIVSRASKLENIARLRKAGADKIVSPEIIGGKDLYLESAKPHLLRLTVQHTSDEIFDEFKIIAKHGCTLENIDYHIPGIETPLNREIKTMNINDGKRYKKYLNSNKDAKEALDNLYKSVNNVHSHLISGPDRNTFEKLIKDLEKQEKIIGKNLTNEKIMEITKKINKER
ncbi:NAD-binding protein [Methanobrevibacter millerae]|uniref:Potassium channel protein n=1 Tax=Methanobrevibacter millerae TaxID=230361 RepID=A0A0U3E771_9EURY|nr:NAD-binding protein [Methanobrevibacter millerae]ALT69863.1 potassium channel protein [Methanobrevibacter millerae]